MDQDLREAFQRMASILSKSAQKGNIINQTTGMPVLTPSPLRNTPEGGRRSLQEVLGQRPPTPGNIKGMSLDKFQELVDHVLRSRKNLGEDLKRIEGKMSAAEKSAQEAVSKYRRIKAEHDQILADLDVLQRYYLTTLQSRHRSGQ